MQNCKAPCFARRPATLWTQHVLDSSRRATGSTSTGRYFAGCAKVPPLRRLARPVSSTPSNIGSDTILSTQRQEAATGGSAATFYETVETAIVSDAPLDSPDNSLEQEMLRAPGLQLATELHDAGVPASVAVQQDLDVLPGQPLHAVAVPVQPEMATLSVDEVLLPPSSTTGYSLDTATIPLVTVPVVAEPAATDRGPTPLGAVSADAARSEVEQPAVSFAVASSNSMAAITTIEHEHTPVIDPAREAKPQQQEVELQQQEAAPQQQQQAQEQEQHEPGSWKWNLDTGRNLLKFMLPAATVPMADPLMTMIDTVCIGQFSSAVALASLGPANVVFGFTQYLFAALQTAALSIISARLGQGDTHTAQQVLSSALFVAVLLGTCSMLLFEAAAPVLISWTGAEASLVPVSCDYLRLRAIAQPAVLANMVLNSCLLAQRNVAAPMAVVAATSTISLLGNLALVGALGWGATGAAVTTVAAQLVGCAALAAAASTSGQLRPRLKVPSLEEARLFLATLGPLGFVYLCKNASYMMVYTTATQLHTLALAAHQAVFALWNMCSFTSSPFESTALAFFPRSKQQQGQGQQEQPVQGQQSMQQAAQGQQSMQGQQCMQHTAQGQQQQKQQGKGQQEQGQEQPAAVQAGPAPSPSPIPSLEQVSFSRLLLGMGLMNGLLVGLLGASVTLLGPTLLTSEPLLWPLISSVAPHVLATLCLVAVDVAAAGLLFAHGQFRYLAQSYFVTLSALTAFLLLGCRGEGLSLGGVWGALLFFGCLRFVQSVGRLVWLGVLRVPGLEGLWPQRHRGALVAA